MTSLVWFQTEIDPSVDAETEQEDSDKYPQHHYCCAICGALITDNRYAVPINGQQRYIKTNPDNHSFSFGCFSSASGCRTLGDYSDQHSWFSGYQWCFAHCKSCNAQLGWHFRGEQAFFGLILEQLVNCDSEQN